MFKQSTRNLVVGVTAAVLFAAFVAPAVPASAVGQTYYLNSASATCSDSGPGTSVTQPWCSLGHASRGYSAGDQLLIARGSTYSNQFLTISGQGTASSRISIGAYGSGARPSLSGGSNAGAAIVTLQNPSYVSVSGLELSYAGAGVLAQYRANFSGSPTGNQSLFFSDIYVHHISGIGSSRVNGGPQDFACHSNNLDLWQSGGVAVTGDYNVPVSSSSYFVSGVTFDSIVGDHNLNVVNIDTCDGRVGNPGTPGPAAPYLVRNVSVNNVQATNGDGAGYSELCNEGTRFDGVTGLRVTNSTFKNLGACHVNGGTAGIILVSVDTVTFANNTLTDVPATGSADMTAIDNELYVNKVTLRDNLIARNAGPGVEFLSLRAGIGDYNTNHLVDGNTFYGNGGGSLVRINPAGVALSGTVTNNLIGDSQFVNSEEFRSLIPNNAGNITSATSPTAAYAADQFAATQGANGWRYRTSANATSPTAWTDAAFQSGQHVTGVWTDGAAAQISAFEQTPGTERVWTAPATGRVSLRSLAFKSVAGGATVTASVRKNGALVTSATVVPTDTSGKNLDAQIDVAAGDSIEFIAAGTSSSSDWLSWSPSLMYTATAGTGAGSLGNSSFEQPFTGGYQYAPADRSWTFASFVAGTAGDGVVANGSTFGNPAASAGGQAAFVQAQGSVTQKVQGLLSTGYKLSFDAAQRSGNSQSLKVTWDGTVVGTITPSSASYSRYTLPTISGTAGIHTLVISGVATSDQTAFLDNVSLAPAPSTDASFADPSFETARVSGYAYAPSGSGWNFAATSSGNGDGIVSNGSAFGQGNAPDGTQSGFVQQQGSIAQTVSGFLAAKRYAVVFSAAQRPGQSQTIKVLIDGAVVSTVIPSGSQFATYTTAPFMPGAGAHTVTFLGGATVDQTAFIDSVIIADAS
ncbi:hypothetical protein ACF1AJ_17690 [Leifsonia sp. NPDC014704]|uniref:hypothetical protein n=1 Tax=Leifsonia sp. NPDC014704 TaxID=3364123 RepID=UPI0036F4AC05